MINNNLSQKTNKKKPIFSWNNESNIKIVKNSIRNNKICITSTDTILGFTANLTKTGFEALNNLKERSATKPYLILISGPEKLSIFIDEENLTPQIQNLISKCWPGPVTIIFKARKELPSFLTSKNNTIALRSPKNPYLLKLLKSFDGLFSTSANKTTDSPPKNLDEISNTIIEKVECIIVENNNSYDNKNSNAKKNNLFIDTKASMLQNLPSTIIDATSGKKIKVIRKGAYSINELEKYYGSKFERSEKK